MLLIILYSSLMGALRGASIQFAALRFRTLRTMPRRLGRLLNEVSEGILGDTMVRIPTGIYFGWFFWRLSVHVFDHKYIVMGSVLGALRISSGSLLILSTKYTGKISSLLLPFRPLLPLSHSRSS